MVGQRALSNNDDGPARASPTGVRVPLAGGIPICAVDPDFGVQVEVAGQLSERVIELIAVVILVEQERVVAPGLDDRGRATIARPRAGRVSLE